MIDGLTTPIFRRIIRKTVPSVCWRLKKRGSFVEKLIEVRIVRLPEGCYLATSEAIQGLVAQGRTIEETLQIARDVAKKLLEAQENLLPKLPEAGSRSKYQLVVGV